MGESGLDDLPFWWQGSSSDTTSYNTSVFWDWVIRNQWLWALLFLSILWGKKERLKQCQSSQDSLAQWSLDTAYIG